MMLKEKQKKTQNFKNVIDFLYNSKITFQNEKIKIEKHNVAINI